jgi:hypothetical protein
MTNQYPITPPNELLLEWGRSSNGWYEAAQWGADRELEACCEWLDRRLFGRDEIAELRKVRRPKPPSLKEQALEQLRIVNAVLQFQATGGETSAIRLALESLID